MLFVIYFLHVFNTYFQSYFCFITHNLLSRFILFLPFMCKLSTGDVEMSAQKIFMVFPVGIKLS